MKEVIAYDAIFECQTARNPTTLLDPLTFQHNIVRPLQVRINIRVVAVRVHHCMRKPAL